MCLIETQCEIRLGKHLSVLLLTRRGFIDIHQWNWRLGRSNGNQERLQLNETRQNLAYTDGRNLLTENMNIERAIQKRH
jgi:hypothetical protein